MSEQETVAMQIASIGISTLIELEKVRKENKRLHALNHGMLEALKSIVHSKTVARNLEQQWCAAASGMVRIARAAIAKAKSA